MVKLLILLIATVFAATPPQLLERDRIDINIEVGTPTQTFKLHPDTGASISIVPGTAIKEREVSLSSPKKNLFLNKGKIGFIEEFSTKCRVILFEDKFKWDDYLINKFNFGIIDESYSCDESEKTGKLALNYQNPTSDEYLFVRLLTSKIFVFSFDKTGFNVELNPSEIDYGNHFRCEVIKKDVKDTKFKDNWICDFSYFMLGSNEFENAVRTDGLVSFDSGSSFITAPMQYANIFMETLDNACFVENSADFSHILCPKGTVVDPLTLLIDGRGYTIPSEELLLPFSEQYLVYGVLFSYNIDEVWNVGLLFFRTFELTFDYSDSMIRFKGPEMKDYSSEPAYYSRHKKKVALPTVFFIGFAVVLFGWILVIGSMCLAFKQVITGNRNITF